MPLKSKKLWFACLAVAVVLLASGAAVHQTSQNEFCLSCHEMKIYYDEQMASSHAKDADGNPIGCAQCHIPNTNAVRMLAVKTYLGALDLWTHYTGDTYNLDRAQMQGIARRFIDDNNCLTCHEDLTKNAKNDGQISTEGKLAHESYQGKNGQSRHGCVGCHSNLAHLPTFDARIPKNADFLKKLNEFKEVE